MWAAGRAQTLVDSPAGRHTSTAIASGEKKSEIKREDVLTQRWKERGMVERIPSVPKHQMNQESVRPVRLQLLNVQPSDTPHEPPAHAGKK